MAFLSSTFQSCIKVMLFSGSAPFVNEEGENIGYKMYDLMNTARIFILILAHDLSQPF